MVEMKYRRIRRVDFTAESLEALAKRIPASMKERAENLREMAKFIHQSDDQQMIRIVEEQGGIEGTDFIMSDSDSR